MNRKRTKKTAAAQIRPFWILIVLAASGLGAGAYYAVSWPGFRVKQISVMVPPSVNSRQVLRLAAISQTSNIWLQNMRAARTRIETIPYVLDVRIHRGLPASLSIAVTDRVPFAILESHSQSLVIDRELRVLEDAHGEGRSLPTFVIKRTTALTPGSFTHEGHIGRMRDDYDALIAGHVVPASLSFDKYDQLIASLGNGVRLLLGDDRDLARKIPLVEPILSQITSQGRKIRALDLRAPNTPVAVYK